MISLSLSLFLSLSFSYKAVMMQVSVSNTLESPSNYIRRSAVDRENLKPYWKSEKRPHCSR